VPTPTAKVSFRLIGTADGSKCSLTREHECSNALARQTVNLRSLERTLCCVASVLRTRGLRGAYALLREVRVIGGLGGHELHRTLEQRHLDDRV
jgi:hypothetical protein